MREDEIPRHTLGREEKRVEIRIDLGGEEEDVSGIEKGSSESEEVRMEGNLHRDRQSCLPTVN